MSDRAPLSPARAVSEQGIDVVAMRANLHATFNGGWQDAETIRAFHHGMDTVCNVLEAHQRRESTNGILPAAPAEGLSPERLRKVKALVEEAAEVQRRGAVLRAGCRAADAR